MPSNQLQKVLVFVWKRASAEPEKGALQRAARFLSAGFHTGFLWGVSSLKWTERTQLEIVTASQGCVTGFVH